MDKKNKIIFSILKIVSIFVLFYTGSSFFIALNPDTVEFIVTLGAVCFIVYNEIRTHRQLSIMDLISLREEIHGFNSQLAIFDSQLQTKLGLNELQELRLETKEQVSEMREYYHEINNKYTELTTTFQMLQNAQPQVEEEYYEEVKPKSRRKKK